MELPLRTALDEVAPKPDLPVTPQPDGVTIYHAVMDHGTVTFLHYDTLKDFLSGWVVDDIGKKVIVCESYVSFDEYDQLTKWQGLGPQ